MPRRQPVVEAMARIVASADFERVLASRSRASTTHFAVHHAPAPPIAPPGPADTARPSHLSTETGQSGARPVDDSSPGVLRKLGAVVPKRHARRAVTRSLLKRQIYAAGGRHAQELARGLWIVRLRAPFERSRYASAASRALRHAARSELDELFRAAGRTATP